MLQFTRRANILLRVVEGLRESLGELVGLSKTGEHFIFDRVFHFALGFAQCLSGNLVRRILIQGEGCLTNFSFDIVRVVIKHGKGIKENLV